MSTTDKDYSSSIDGNLTIIGKGKMTLDGFKAVVEQKDRCSAGESVPAQGLFLQEVEYRFNAILKKCGLKETGFHSTRRTFASRCIERGMDPKTLSEILGHASVSTTLDLYVRINLQRKADSLKLLTDLFSV